MKHAQAVIGKTKTLLRQKNVISMNFELPKIPEIFLGNS